MSLLDSFYRMYNVMEQTAADDTEGGQILHWMPGAAVKMALDAPTQTQHVIAEAQRVSVIQNALFPIDTPVCLNTYLRAMDDESAVYMVRTNPEPAPGPSGIRVRKAEVIKTVLPE